jgi:mannose-6-phosphate isomerase-like protein (cupin superfamily)
VAFYFFIDINELRRQTMSSTKDRDEKNSRRAFFQEITAGTAGLAVAGALAQLAAPQMAAAQYGNKQAPKQAESPFFKNPPPWPEGTNGSIYDHLFCTKLKENSLVPDIVPGPQAYFRGESDLPGAKINMGFQIFTKPYKLEMESHHHDTDEYLFFLGSTFPDLVGSFDAEIEYFMGKEYEKHIITKATVLYIPAGLEHNPCNIRKIGKPMFFSALQLAPYFNGKYQTQGYMEFRGAQKID